jgi:hypothetical protein
MLKRKDLVFVAIAVLIVGVLTWLSMTGKEKFIQRIPPHVAAIYIQDRAEADQYCAKCHDPKLPGAAALDNTPKMPPNHPLRTKNCRLCHRLERKK